MSYFTGESTKAQRMKGRTHLKHRLLTTVAGRLPALQPHTKSNRVLHALLVFRIKLPGKLGNK